MQPGLCGLCGLFELVADVAAEVLPLEGLVGGGVAGDEAGVVAEEAEEHDRDHDEGEAEADERGVLVDEPAQRDGVADGDQRAVLVADVHLEQVLGREDGPEDVGEQDAAVEAQEGVREEEGEEVADVVGAHAVVDPRAVVVEAGDTGVACGAVLGSGGSQEPAGAAGFLAVDDPVVVESLELGFDVLLGYDAGICGRSKSETFGPWNNIEHSPEYMARANIPRHPPTIRNALILW